MAVPLILVLAAGVLCTYRLARIPNWRLGLLGAILLWLLLNGILVSIYPRMDAVTGMILIGGTGTFVWFMARPKPKLKPFSAKESYVQHWIRKTGEASMSIETEWLPYFLPCIIPLVALGFTHVEVESLLQSVAVLQVEEERDFDFQVQFQGQSVPLHVKIFMSNIDEVSLYFFTAKGLASKIDIGMRVWQQATEMGSWE